MVPGGGHSQGCHGYLPHLLLAPTAFSGHLPPQSPIGDEFKVFLGLPLHHTVYDFGIHCAHLLCFMMV